MKGQLTTEFLVITFLLTAYLSVVFSLFSSVRGSLQRAVDRKLAGRVERWVRFVAARPEGTRIRLELSPYPGRYLSVECGNRTRLSYPSGGELLDVASGCGPLNITGNTCLAIESTGGGVTIEVC